MRGTNLEMREIPQAMLPNRQDVALECYVTEAPPMVVTLFKTYLCEHCEDAGWMRWADWRVTSTYSDDLQPEHVDRKVCQVHLIAEVENFRDAGR